MRDHQWTEVRFSWGGYIECSCGYRPTSQEQMDAHRHTSIHFESSGETK